MGGIGNVLMNTLIMWFRLIDFQFVFLAKMVFSGRVRIVIKFVIISETLFVMLEYLLLKNWLDHEKNLGL